MKLVRSSYPRVTTTPADLRPELASDLHRVGFPARQLGLRRRRDLSGRDLSRSQETLLRLTLSQLEREPAEYDRYPGVNHQQFDPIPQLVARKPGPTPPHAVSPKDHDSEPHQSDGEQ